MAMFGGGGPQPKGDILPLWRALGLDIPRQPGPMGLAIAQTLCWHEYNPYPVLAETSEASTCGSLHDEEHLARKGPFSSESEISKGLKEVMFLYAGVIRAAPESESKCRRFATRKDWLQTGRDNG
jgi:ABC-2 type transport system permease protein